MKLEVTLQAITLCASFVTESFIVCKGAQPLDNLVVTWVGWSVHTLCPALDKGICAINAPVPLPRDLETQS